MGYIYISHTATFTENRFLNPTPFDILVRASKVFRFLFAPDTRYAKDLFYSGISAKVLRFTLHVWKVGITYPLYLFSHRFKPLN